MRKIKEVLRLRFGLGLRQDQIAHSCSIGQATVHRYLEKAAAAGLSWPLPDDCDDHRLEQLLFPTRPGQPNSKVRPVPDFDEVQRQMQEHKHLTLQLIWEEYREGEAKGYGYSRYVGANISAGSASYTSGGIVTGMLSCGKTTGLEKRCSSTGLAPRFPSLIRRPA